MGRAPRSFSPAAKQEAVRLLAEGRRSVHDVAEQLGIRPDSVRRWKHSLEMARRPPKLPVAELEAAYQRLEQENAQLRQELEFAKKAAAFFATGSDGGLP